MENKLVNKLVNNLKQCILFAIISIPFVFWYLAVIASQDTYDVKFTSIGFISALHITISIMGYFMKKDFEN